MADKEFGRVCQKCKKRGGDTFARMYYKPIDGKWLRLCGSCWGAVFYSVQRTAEDEAAQKAYEAGLGVSEWEAFMPNRRR